MYFRALSRVFARHLTVSGPIRLRNPCPNFLSVGSSAIGNGHFRLFTSQIQENGPREILGENSVIFDDQSNKKVENLESETPALRDARYLLFHRSLFHGKSHVKLLLYKYPKKYGPRVRIQTENGYLLFDIEQITELFKRLENAKERTKFFESYKVNGRRFLLRDSGKKRVEIKIVKPDKKTQKVVTPSIVIRIIQIPTLKENLEAILDEYEKLKNEEKEDKENLSG
uniref:Uncharacterized protein n=1 Tax=Acrobeloides nanus TaxID=290746 RepID=A0A914CY27_9BILA